MAAFLGHNIAGGFCPKLCLANCRADLRELSMLRDIIKTTGRLSRWDEARIALSRAISYDARKMARLSSEGWSEKSKPGDALIVDNR